jgi:hypothetical protein
MRDDWGVFIVGHRRGRSWVIFSLNRLTQFLGV